jgi:flagellar basal body-associated protein FliL
MASGDGKGFNRLLQLAVVISLASVVLMAVVLTLGVVMVKAKLNPVKVTLKEVPLPGPTVAISDQVYNLGEPNRYLKATILLEMNSDNKSDKQLAGLSEEVKKREAQIRDIVIRVISGKTYREVNSPQGKEQLKDELKTRINEVLARGEIKRIMFTSFAVQ